MKIERIHKNLEETINKNALTIGYCIGLTLTLMHIIRDSLLFRNSSLETTFIVYFISGIFLSLCANLCNQVYDKRKVRNITIIWHILIICNAFYAGFALEGSHLSTPCRYDVYAVIALCIVSPFVMPFIGKRNNDLEMWYFARNFLINTALNGLIVVILLVGFLILVSCVEMLFGLRLNDYYTDSFAFSFCLVLPTMILMRTEQLSANKEIKVNDNFSLTVFRIFAVLLFLYLTIVYAYMLHIITTWELPKGNVSMPVSCMMFLLIIVYCIAYGINLDGKEKDLKFLRIMPRLALLPLLLMSVGIGRRLMDYGMTAPRFYLVLLNLWFYSMCVYMMLKQRIMPIVVSFVVIAFMSSFGPTSAWRLFDVNKIVEATKNQEIVEEPKYKHIEYAGYDYMYAGFEIKLPEPAKNLTFFEIYDGFELLPTENGNEYFIESIEGFPFIIPRNKLINREQVPLILKCTNGKYIVLTKWKCKYNDDEISKEVEINEMLGFMVE